MLMDCTLRIHMISNNYCCFFRRWIESKLRRIMRRVRLRKDRNRDCRVLQGMACKEGFFWWWFHIKCVRWIVWGSCDNFRVCEWAGGIAGLFGRLRIEIKWGRTNFLSKRQGRIRVKACSLEIAQSYYCFTDYSSIQVNLTREWRVFVRRKRIRRDAPNRKKIEGAVPFFSIVPTEIKVISEIKIDK